MEQPPRVGTTRGFHKIQVPVFLDEGRIDLLMADQKEALMPTFLEHFGHSDTGSEMTTGAPAGDDNFTHKSRCPRSAGSSQERKPLSIMPVRVNIKTRFEPP